jgi:hypothetical protein
MAGLRWVLLHECLDDHVKRKQWHQTARSVISGIPEGRECTNVVSNERHQFTEHGVAIDGWVIVFQMFPDVVQQLYPNVSREDGEKRSCER